MTPEREFSDFAGYAGSAPRGRARDAIRFILTSNQIVIAGVVYSAERVELNLGCSGLVAHLVPVRLPPFRLFGPHRFRSTQHSH